MSEHSGIEWTDATWNPITGCTAVSPGCANCYAARLTATRLDNPKYAGLATTTNDAARWTDEIRCHADELEAPLKWPEPRYVFVNSMSDTFHAGVPVGFLDRMFAVMALCPQHNFLVLTKRPERMQKYIVAKMFDPDCYDEGFYEAIDDIGEQMKIANALDRVSVPLLNVWLGTSVEDQTRADTRIAELTDTPASVRFLSIEPLLGPINLPSMLHGIHGVIAGGESGPHSRAVNPDWVRSLRGQCVKAGVPFFFKQ
jgi:protein gp37